MSNHSNKCMEMKNHNIIRDLTRECNIKESQYLLHIKLQSQCKLLQSKDKQLQLQQLLRKLLQQNKLHQLVHKRHFLRTSQKQIKIPLKLKLFNHKNKIKLRSNKIKKSQMKKKRKKHNQRTKLPLAILKDNFTQTQIWRMLKMTCKL
jgi:hypothetical protein